MNGPEAFNGMGAPPIPWSQRPSPHERASPEQMIEIAAAYFTAHERNDGARTAPLAPVCRRLDIGYAHQNPRFDKHGEPPFHGLWHVKQLALGYFEFVTEIRARRCPVVDEELVFCFPLLDHAGTVHKARVRDRCTVPIGVRQTFCLAEVVLNKVP